MAVLTTAVTGFFFLKPNQNKNLDRKMAASMHEGWSVDGGARVSLVRCGFVFAGWRLVDWLID